MGFVEKMEIVATLQRDGDPVIILSDGETYQLTDDGWAHVGTAPIKREVDARVVDGSDSASKGLNDD